MKTEKAEQAQNAGAPEITNEMVEAGMKALLGNFQALSSAALDEYPLIARTVYEAMLESSPARAREEN